MHTLVVVVAAAVVVVVVVTARWSAAAAHSIASARTATRPVGLAREPCRSDLGLRCPRNLPCSRFCLWWWWFDWSCRRSLLVSKLSGWVAWTVRE